MANLLSPNYGVLPEMCVAKKRERGKIQYDVYRQRLPTSFLLHRVGKSCMKFRFMPLSYTGTEEPVRSRYKYTRHSVQIVSLTLADAVIVDDCLLLRP